MVETINFFFDTLSDRSLLFERNGKDIQTEHAFDIDNMFALLRFISQYLPLHGLKLEQDYYVS